MADPRESLANEAWHIRLAEMFAEISAVAGFSPPRAMTDGFFALHKDLIETIPVGLAHLNPKNADAPDWLARLRHAVLTSVQEGLYASQYHLTRVESIEDAVVEIAKRHAPSLDMPPGSGAGGGNSRALNCEYQAFAFAIRRTLEYLAVATAAFFKTECHSIRRLGGAINSREPADIRSRVQSALAEHLPLLRDILPDDKHSDRSLRDRLAHWESVPAGSFNVSKTSWGYDIGVAGGGHELPPFRPRPSEAANSSGQMVAASKTLGPVLREQYERVERAVFDVLGAIGIRVHT